MNDSVKQNLKWEEYTPKNELPEGFSRVAFSHYYKKSKARYAISFPDGNVAYIFQVIKDDRYLRYHYLISDKNGNEFSVDVRKIDGFTASDPSLIIDVFQEFGRDISKRIEFYKDLFQQLFKKAN